MTSVDQNLVVECTREASALLAHMEAGSRPDLQQLSRSFGAALEFLLCDLFRLHPAGSSYWVDGVLVDATAMQAPRVAVLKCRAWCADHAAQWQVPAEITCTF